MKPYLVDVPVRVNIWIRPDCQRKQFDVIIKARPCIMFLQSDGGRNEKEWESIHENRKIFDNEIDWECQVYRFYEDHNNGLYAMGKKVSDFIWEHVDRCIFLEDDHIPSVSFFRFCAEMLEKYKDDLRVECICGMNHLGVCENVTADYFFSKQGSIWGNATWKRCAEMRDSTFSYGKDPYIMGLLKKEAKHNKMFLKRAEAYTKQEYYEGHVAGTEYYREFAMYGYNQLQIIPKYNMICNIGATSDSAHVDELKMLPKGIRRVFNMKTYEIKFPLKYTDYVIPDAEYEKKRNRIMGYNAPLHIALWRKFERGWYKIISGDIIYVIDKIKNRGKRIER